MIVMIVNYVYYCFLYIKDIYFSISSFLKWLTYLQFAIVCNTILFNMHIVYKMF